MLALQILILVVLLFAVPTIAGAVLTRRNDGLSIEKIPFIWICGQILLWAGFQCICVPLILLEKEFPVAVNLFNVYTCILLVVSLVFFIPGLLRKSPRLRPVPTAESTGKRSRILWIIFAALILLQLVLTIFMAYEEGDDAFYLAISTITENADTMYQKLPYTGTGTGLDARHGLAPFPIWVAWLARMSGMHAITVSQIILPLALILMAYALYYFIGKALLAKRPHLLPLFMVFVALMILFGGYSTYSAENFLLVRTSQGKAVIANIIIPFLLLLAIQTLEHLQKEEKIRLRHWLLLACTMLSGCLCSTLGTLLTCMFLGIVGICAAVSYRKWTFLFPMAVCCIAPACFAFLYLVLA